MDYLEEQKELDRIIEKIKQGGYAALTEEEQHKFFHTKLDSPGTTRFDSKFEFWLTITLLIVLISHGVQRLLLAKEMIIRVGVHSIITNSTVNTVCNILLGAAMVFGAAFVLFSFMNDLRKNRIVFFYRKDNRMMRRKYYLQVTITIVFIILVLLKTISYWTVLFETAAV